MAIDFVFDFIHFFVIIEDNFGQLHNLHYLAKGQLISKCPYEIIVSSKIPTKLFLDFCPDFFVASWGLPGSFLGFLGT